MIWKSSLYKFVIPDKLDENGEQTYKEVVMDVTDSAPSFEDPKETLGAVLDQVLQLIHARPKFILDFGAGKLRNTVYLLKKKCNVCAVEFEKIHKSSEQGKRLYKHATAHGDRFIKLIFPHQFFASKLKFNIALLINVCNIIPVPSERLLALQYCREKIEDDGFVLWYTQHRDADILAKCVPDVKIGDGYYMNTTRRYQTFYRDFDTSEIDAMFLANGFRFIQPFEAGKNQARLYKKVGTNPLAKVLSAKTIRKYVEGDKEIPERKKTGVQILRNADKPQANIPNPDELKEETLYVEALRKLPAGREHATDYHNLIAAILIKLFIPQLSHPQLEYDLHDGKKRIDIVMTNPSEQGFFAGLYRQFQIRAPYILIECKNYNMEINNDELDQLNGRFKPRWGQFGILTYRKVMDRARLLERCRTYLDSNYILPLSDDDIIKMLNLRLANDVIDGYMQERMQELVLSG